MVFALYPMQMTCAFGKNHSEATTPNTSGHSRLKHAIYPENTDKPRFAAYPPCETARRLYAFQFFATAFHDTAWSFAP